MFSANGCVPGHTGGSFGYGLGSFLLPWVTYHTFPCSCQLANIFYHVFVFLDVNVKCRL